MTRARKDIYPIFLPHAGCPFQCVYCNQHAVTSGLHQGADILESVESRLRAFAEHVRGCGRPGEVAFFGGTFTALRRELMEAILARAAFYVETGIFTGIRFSTRPDCMEEDTVRRLARYPVRTVELGVQSLSDRVLAQSRRGYSARIVHDAAARVQRQGWLLGVQLMAGLPGDNMERFLNSVSSAIDMGTDFFRFYPTLVLEGTSLADSFRRGDYLPLSLEDAVTQIAAAYDLVRSSGTPVIRMGLHSDTVLERPGSILAGPWHPAFGYLVKGRWWRDRLDKEFSLLDGLAGSEVLLRVAANRVSDLIGEKRTNLAHWTSRWKIKQLTIQGDPEMREIETRIEIVHDA